MGAAACSSPEREKSAFWGTKGVLWVRWAAGHSGAAGPIAKNLVYELGTCCTPTRPWVRRERNETKKDRNPNLEPKLLQRQRAEVREGPQRGGC